MPIKTTIGVAALAAAASLAGTSADASPVALNKNTTITGAAVQTVDYHCYRRHGRRYCRDTYDDYDDSYYDYDYYGPGIVIGAGRRHHHHGDGGMHYYRGAAGGHAGPSVGGAPGGPVGHAAGGGMAGGGGAGGHGHH